MASKYTIGVIGLWHLGEIYSAGFAELGHNVIGISDDQKVVQDLFKNIPPLEEPRLRDLLKTHQEAKRLSYTSDYTRLKECNVVWFTFDTPVDDNDEVDLAVVYDAVKKSTPYLQDGVLIAFSSQLPVGTSKKIKEMIRAARPDLKFEYLYSPENLRLGAAVQCFLEPGRVVVGADDPATFEKAKEIFSMPNTEIVTMSTASAEMAKHAMNAWLAMSISFTNDLADVAEREGADIEEVIRALKSEPRVGQKAYLFAGLGFSGGTLGRDLRALMAAGKELNIELPVIEAIWKKNKSRNAIVLTRLQKELGDIRGKMFAMFGVTYKAGTSTLRRSQPLEIEKTLREAGATFRLYDPLAKVDEVAERTPSPFFSDPYEAAKGVDMILLMTPSQDYKNLDFPRLISVMKSPAFFDTQNVLCSIESTIKGAGMKYLSIGR